LGVPALGFVSPIGIFLGAVGLFAAIFLFAIACAQKGFAYAAIPHANKFTVSNQLIVARLFNRLELIVHLKFGVNVFDVFPDCPDG
jgi:hypothetical protein